MTEKNKGILYMIIASVSFAMMAVMAQFLKGEIHFFQQVFFRNLIMLPLIIIMIKRFKLSYQVPRTGRLSLFLRCFFGLAGMLCLFYANSKLYIADVLVLQKLNPFFVTLLAVFLLGERLTLKKLIPLLIAFIGAIVIVNPQGNYQLFPSLVAILAAFSAATAYTLVRRLKGTVPGLTIIFYFCLFCFLVLIIPAIMVWTPPTALQWFYLIMIGIFASLGQYFITEAYQATEASAVALYDYAGAIASPLLGYLFLGNALGLRTLVGMILIIGSGVVSFYLKKERRTLHENP